MSTISPIHVEFAKYYVRKNNVELFKKVWTQLNNEQKCYILIDAVSLSRFKIVSAILNSCDFTLKEVLFVCIKHNTQMLLELQKNYCDSSLLVKQIMLEEVMI